jgi:hypothetical protein
MPRAEFFLPRALFCSVCWSAFLITTRAILAVFCARQTYTALVGDALRAADYVPFSKLIFSFMSIALPKKSGSKII